MKTKIKRHSRSALSILLTICMLVSCMTVGLIATDAAKVQSEAVGLDSGDGMYLGIGSADNMQWYGMGSNEKELVLDSAKTIYFHFYVGGSKFAMGSTSTQPSEACTEDWTLYAQKNASNNISASLPAGTYKFKLKGVQSNNTNCLEYQFWKVSGGSGGGDDPTPSGDVTEVTDADLISILQGTKAQFYFAHEGSNNGRYLYDSSSTQLASGDFKLFTNCKAGYATVPATNYVPTGVYYISDWEGWQGRQIPYTIKAGYLYCMINKDASPSPTFHSTGHLDNSTDATVSWSTSSATVKYGATSSSISATKSGSTPYAALGSVKYYYQDGTKFYEFDPSSLPALEPGTYNVYAAASDGKIYIAATSKGTLTVSPPLASELTLNASKTTLTEVEESTTLTATATALQNVAVTYKLYKEGTATPIDTQSKAAGTTSATFTVTPNARSTTYYVTVSPTTGTAYDAVTSNSVTIANTADDYIPKYTVTFDSNNANYGTVTAKDGNGNDIASGTKVKEGDSVTFTATPKAGNVFTSWSAFDTTATSVTRVIRADTTVRGNFGPKGYKLLAGSNVTQNMRELANGTYISEALTSNNWFIIVKNATEERSKGNASPQELSTDGTKYDVTWMNGTTWSDSNTYKKTTGTHYVVYDPATNKVWLTSDKDDLYTVRVIAKDGTLRYGYTNHSNYTHSYGNTTLTATDAEGGTYTGTDDYDFKYDNDNTTYYAAEKIEFNADAVRKGITLKVQTQVNNDKLSEGYYVKGFVVSGYEESFSVLWQDDEADLADINRGYNEFTLTLPAYPAKDIEITPVYWIKETEDNKTVRFYVDGFAGDVYKEWDGNLAIQAFQKNGTPVLGEYPGQPMINYNGRYVVDIPREDLGGITLNNYVWDRVHSNLFYGTTGIANPDTTNGYLQKIQAANKQTYDFNDFIYIKEGLETDTDTDNDDEDIIFSFRYKYDENHNTVATSNHGQMTYYKDSDAAGKDPVVTVDTNYDYENQCNTLDPTDNIYQWEELTDFYHNRVDILGNYVDLKDPDGTITNPKAAYTNPVRIVSNGYDFNEAGKYATAWAVYVPVDANDNLAPTGSYHHYKLIEVFGGQGKVKKEGNNWIGKWGSSSYLVNPKWRRNLEDKYDWEHHQQHEQEGTETVANFIYDLANMPTVISYEYSIRYNKSNLNLEQAGNQATDGNPGLRSDGRWYASKSDQLLTAHTIIEYAEKDEESLYQRDFYQAGGIDYNSESGYDPSKNTGIATGIQAYFENSNSDTLENVSFQNHSGETRAYSISDGEEKHNFLLKTVGDANGEYAFKGWYLYTNGKYSWVSSDPTYSSEATANDVYVARYYKVPSGTLNVTHNLHPDSTGTANCYAKVEVMNGNDVVYTYAETTDAIKVTSAHMKSSSTNTLRITLRTVPDNKSSFAGFYEKLSETIEALAVKGVLASVTVTSNKAIIVTKQIKDFFDNTGAQTIKALPFYSMLNQKNFAHTKILYSHDRYVSDGIDSALDTYGIETVLSAFSRDYYQSGSIDWKSASGYDKTDVTGLTTNAQAYMTSGGNNVTELEFSENDIITLNAANTPAVNNSRYSFVGWFVQKTDGTLVKLSNSYTTAANTYTAAAADKDLVFIAVFEPVLTYSIKYTYDSTHYGSQYYLVTGTFTAQEIATYLVWSNTDSSAEGLDGSYSYKSNTKAQFFAAKSPYEKNVGKSFQWEFTNDTTAHYSANHQLSSTVPSHNGTDTTRKIQFIFPYRVKNTDSGTETQTTDGKVYIVPDGQSYKDGQYSRYLNIHTATYGQPYVLNWQDTATGEYLSNYITAEEKIFDSNNDEYHFAYWSIQNIPVNVRTSDPAAGAVTEYDKQVEVARCYNLGFNFTIYQDYIVEPIYIKSTSSIAKTHSNSATIAFTEYGRNQWNANGGGTTVPTAQKTQGDKIFLQFMAAFDRADMTRLDSQTTIKAGILYERLGELTAEQKANVPSPANLFTTYGGKDSTHGKDAAISAVASTTNTTVGKSQYAIMKLDTAEKLQKIDNKNRIAVEQGVTHKKNDGTETGYANYIYRAYAYMVEANGTVTISDQPVYFTFYTIANMADGSREG